MKQTHPTAADGLLINKKNFKPQPHINAPMQPTPIQQQDDTANGYGGVRKTSAPTNNYSAPTELNVYVILYIITHGDMDRILEDYLQKRLEERRKAKIHQTPLV